MDKRTYKSNGCDGKNKNIEMEMGWPCCKNARQLMGKRDNIMVSKGWHKKKRKTRDKVER